MVERAMGILRKEGGKKKGGEAGVRVETLSFFGITRDLPPKSSILLVVRRLGGKVGEGEEGGEKKRKEDAGLPR